ncbi:DUF4174 domain-containing protein [Hymenobacter sp. HD11105]
MLRSLVLVLMASGLALNCLAQANRTEVSLPERIKAQRWQKRIVILCAPTAETPALTQQKASMRAAEAQVKTRDMLVLEAIETELTTAEKQYVRQTLGITPGSFAVVLIGKDGGVKRKDSKPIDPKVLFETIDTMPMRRQEMRANNK